MPPRKTRLLKAFSLSFLAIFLAIFLVVGFALVAVAGAVAGAALAWVFLSASVVARFFLSIPMSSGCEVVGGGLTPAAGGGVGGAGAQALLLVVVYCHRRRELAPASAFHSLHYPAACDRSPILISISSSSCCDFVRSI